MTDSLTTNIKHLLTALVLQGVHDFVVSPGSRTTPIALLLAEMQKLRDDVRVTVDVDERSAAFFALGIAKTTHQPVALLATSGTATGNYLPAIMEASISHIPLIALTTDRPQELQEVGAPQTVHQTNLYGDHTKSFTAITVQDNHEDVTDYIDYRVQELVGLAMTKPAGPIQINLPLRKPLMPILGETWPTVATQQILVGQQQMGWQNVQALAALLRKPKAMMLLGPDEVGWNIAKLKQLAAHYQLPVLADVLSNFRPSEYAISGIDSLLAADVIKDDLKPEVVIRFGGTPVSAKVTAWLRDAKITVVQIGQEHAGHDHARHAQTTVIADADAVVADLLAEPGVRKATFLEQWQKVSATLLSLTMKTDEQGAEYQIPAALADLPENGQLFIANSMPIRDMDNYYVPNHSIKIAANRGANGIDGTISSAFGMAMTGKPTTLLTGDLTLFHDMNGLMLSHQAHVPLTIVVVNNQGGGIFSFLPQAAAKAYFEPMFGTPLPIVIERIARLYDAEYKSVDDLNLLYELVHKPATRLRIIEVKSNREQNVVAHQKLTQAIKEALS